MRPLLAQAALRKLAAEEVEWLLGHLDPAAIAAALLQHPVVMISDHRWCIAGRARALQPTAMPVLDQVGTGDAFLADLLHRFCAQQALLRVSTDSAAEQALPFASVCGALVCTGGGAIDIQSTRNESANDQRQNR